LPSTTSIGCAPGSKTASNHAFTGTLNAPGTGRFAKGIGRDTEAEPPDIDNGRILALVHTTRIYWKVNIAGAFDAIE
jgi:hypothetical protein